MTKAMPELLYAFPSNGPDEPIVAWATPHDEATVYVKLDLAPSEEAGCVECGGPVSWNSEAVCSACVASYRNQPKGA